MAKLVDNVITYGASGAFAGQFVFRRVNGKVFICKMPGPRSSAPTAGELANRERFAFANAYATAAVNNVQLKAIYQAAARPGQSAHNRAFRDAFNAPRVTQLHIENGMLKIRAVDDFRVVKVMVKVLNEYGFEEETGEAALSSGNVWWGYRLRGDVAGKTVLVAAYDLAGNAGHMDFK
ncbi:hypothetical protein [Chitinophaga sp.]|uniref:hypothetical protein n=1 Tax=Chitinophaga sp. TaxID=1869181 RepID=UPI0031E154D8